MRTSVLMRRMRFFAAALVLATCLAGCEDDLTYNPESTINLITPKSEWPKDKKKLSPAHKAVLEKYGRPDAMRLLWNAEGKVASRDEVRAEMKQSKTSKKSLPPTTWVYVQRGVEVYFNGAQPMEKPLTDEIKLIVRYGDPELVKAQPGGAVQWTFYSVGKMYTLMNGKIASEKDFPAMGSYGK